MTHDPHSLIEGVIIASYAIRANRAYIYIRGEAVHAARRLRNAVDEAYAKPATSARTSSAPGFDLDLVVHSGAGAYICGEETALLDSLEGFRGQPRLRPPFPATHGLYACPTVVNNVGTIASVPYIVLGGAAWWKTHGHGEVVRPDDLLALRPDRQPGPVRVLDGHHAARADRAGRRHAARARAEVLDPGRLVDAAAHRRAPGRAAGLRGGGGGRLDPRHHGDADLLRPGLPGLRDLPVAGVLPPRVVRQVHPVPRGQLLDGPGLPADPLRPGHPRGPGHPAGHLRQHPRPLVLRSRRRRDQPGDLVAEVLQAGLPGLHRGPDGAEAVATSTWWERTDDSDVAEAAPTPSRSPSTASR